jgi:type I restriction enzyme R subunit
MSPNEAQTRKKLIDPALERAGWDVSDPVQVAIELPVDGYNAAPWNGITDYCLFRANGEVLAVVEAKKQLRDPNVAREQTRHYVTEIAKKQSFPPFAFMTNGLDTYFWNVEKESPRLVAGFFPREDLENRLFLQQSGTPLAQSPVDGKIAGRPYQLEAIRRIGEAFEVKKKRRALLVMATGTGKTRTTVALIDLFLRTNQARRVLFLADRDALVDQAMKDGFQKFLPNEPRDRIYTHTIDPSKRLYVATLQTLSRCYDKFSPGFFDLLVFDEAHRSIFNRFTEVMSYFDARMIGLTATPAGFLDRDTFRTFDCADNTPTFLYDYPQAVGDGHLVDFSLYQAMTGFQRDGVKGANLSEETRNTLIEQGLDPDELDYSGSELEKTVSVTDTLRKQWAEFMDVCFKDISGQLPGKSIVFAITQAHAERLRLVFEEMYPQYVGLVQVITSDTERVRDGSYGDGLITKFKKNDFPRIAISVDMLDTGIDVPEIVNLAFMKPVQSHIKLWQMIGRGTRNDAACKQRDWLPNGKKTEFKIIDFWQNDFNKQAEEKAPADMPVLVRIFNTRLKLLETYLSDQQNPDAIQVKADLRAMVERVPREAFTVKQVLPQIEAAWTDGFWTHTSVSDSEFLRMRVAPLLRFASGVDVAAETFTSKMERLKLQIRKGAADGDTMQSIADDVSRLPDYVLNDAANTKAVALCTTAALAGASSAELTDALVKLAPQMKNRREKPNAFITLDLPDFIAVSGYITLSEGGERIYVKEYRDRVEKRITALLDNHPTITAIREGQDVSDALLIELERTLREKLGEAADVELTTDNIRKAYGLKINSFLEFLRFLLELGDIPDYAVLVQRAFEKHIGTAPYTADQIKFLRSVQNVFLHRKRFAEADLYGGDLSFYGDGAVDVLFTEAQKKALLEMVGKLSV